MLTIPLFLLPVVPSQASEEPSVNLEDLVRSLQDRRFLDPELSELTGPTRVLAVVRDDLPVEAAVQYLTTCRVVSLGGIYLMIGTMPAERAGELMENPSVLALMRDKRVMYPISEFEDSFISPASLSSKPSAEELKEILRRKGRSGGREPDVEPEPTLREVVKVMGAEQVWTEYDVTGEGVTIAIVDTGVDYGAFSLAYWDVMARDSGGYPAAFDADAICMAYTTIALTPFTNATGTFLPTAGLNPQLYVFGWTYNFSDFFGGVFPADMNITGIVSQSGTYHFGVMYQWMFGDDLFPVLVVDSTTPGVYDTVYVDLSFDWAWMGFGPWPPDFSFADETPLTPTGLTVGARDFTGDGLYDISVGSLGYFLDVWAMSPNPADVGLVLKPVDPGGNYVCFENDWYGHGTQCASCAGGRDAGHPFTGAGIAPGTKIMGVVALWIGDVIEGQLWAAGFDLLPGTEGWYIVPGYGTVWGFWNYTGDHKADIISNSWGWSDWALGLMGLPWYDVLTIIEDALTVPGYLHPDYPGTVIVHAGGNGAAGYGTFTSPGYGTLTISVGASTSFNQTPPVVWPGYHDDVISWSARGPNAFGVAKPDVVGVGAWGWTAGPVWYGLGDGSWAFQYFGGTSMATPLVAGSAALVKQAYLTAHGTSPTPEEIKVILKSTAADLGYDAFVQGAGRVDCYAAVSLALEEFGVKVFSPATWDNVRPKVQLPWFMGHLLYPFPPSVPWSPPDGPIVDSSWFAGVVKPGSSVRAIFTIENPTDDRVRMKITPVVHKQVGATLTYEGSTYNLTEAGLVGWLEGYGDLIVMDKTLIPSEAELMVVSLTVPYQYFDSDGNYTFDRRFRIWVLDWSDTNGDGVVDFDETYNLNYGYNVGTTSEARVGFPLQRIKGTPVLWVSQVAGEVSEYVPVPYKVFVNFYKRDKWTWVRTLRTLSVRADSSRKFSVRLKVPRRAAQGVYEGLIKIEITEPYTRTMVIPVSVVVPAVLQTRDMTYKIAPTEPAFANLYDPYRVMGYFDWSWRYEAGDWKMWAFNIEDPMVVAAFVSCSWSSEMTDVDVFGINPQGVITDGTGEYYMTDGIFTWNTRTGTTEEYVVLGTSFFGYTIRGTYTVLLHNVLFNGTVFPEELTGRVDLVKLKPRGPIIKSIRRGRSRSVTFTLSTARELRDIYIVTTQELTTFPVDFDPQYISSISAMGSEKFKVTIDVPRDTPRGTYPVIFAIVANELPFPIYVIIDVRVY
ncbi:MAG: S8 family serine peptidase [Candidatus Freyarchaeota archaeon]